MKFTNKTKTKLFIFAICLNFILRYQLIHHESGIDSFEMHLLANSISEFGQARWWLYPLSIIGMYPNSYASAISFFTSGISQCTGIGIEPSIYLYGIFLSFFSFFAVYILASKFYDDDFFKFITALLYSISPGIVEYSTWTAQGRSFFILMFPMLLYFLVQNIKKHKVRFIFLAFIVTIFLMTTHHLFFYLMPIFFASLMTKLIYKLNKNLQINKHFEILQPLLIIFAFCLVVTYPFITGKFMTLPSKWGNLLNVINEYPRYIGIPILISIGGFFYIILKKNKRYGEWFVIIAPLSLGVFVFDTMYTKWIMIIFAILIAGIGVTNIQKLDNKRRKYGTTLIIVIILFSTFFTGYFQILRFQLIKEYNYKTIDENTYETGMWVDNRVDGISIGNSRWDTWKIAAISTQPFLTGSSSADQAYGLVDARDYELEKKSITSEEFWKDSPYSRIKGMTSDGYWQLIMAQYYSSKGFQYVKLFNINYLVESIELGGNWKSQHGNQTSEFVTYTHQSKDCIFNSGKWEIWKI